MPITILPSPIAGRRPRFASRLLPQAGPSTAAIVQADHARVLALPGRYCNSYLVEGPGSTLVVDCGSTADVEAVCQAVAFLGKPVACVIPSHPHFDHVLGLPALAARLGTSLATGPAAQRYFSGLEGLEIFESPGKYRLLFGWVWEGLPLIARQDLAPLAALASTTLRSRVFAPLGTSLHDGQQLEGFPGWQVLLGRGHSQEDLLLVHAEDGLLICGDALSNFLGGEWSSLNADEAAYRKARARITALSPRAILFGHGPVLQGPDLCRRLGYFSPGHYLRTGRSAPPPWDIP